MCQTPKWSILSHRALPGCLVPSHRPSVYPDPLFSPGVCCPPGCAVLRGVLSSGVCCPPGCAVLRGVLSSGVCCPPGCAVLRGVLSSGVCRLQTSFLTETPYVKDLVSKKIPDRIRLSL